MKNLLAGSRRVTKFLNWLGHKASYHIIQELETELSFTATDSDNCTPTGMSFNSKQVTGAKFNNFDSFLEHLHASPV